MPDGAEPTESGVLEPPPDGYGVLLYYQFRIIEDTELLKDWFTSLCSRLFIVGRIRIAPSGVNATVGGGVAALQEHIHAVKSHPCLGACDFKLAFTHVIPSDITIAKEVGFDCLSVRVVKELVTLGLHPSKCPVIGSAGVYLSAIDFHKRIERAACARIGAMETEASLAQAALINEGCKSRHHSIEKELVVFDVRNIYETRIGKFCPPEGVDFLDPKIRQYSDLLIWIDSNLGKLQNKCILMYCTGGVRCEMASAYIRAKGEGFQDVFQLSGGIQRYLEAFPSGGFFKGKNFVFDHRLAVASFCEEMIGSCLVCGLPFDDYSWRLRCSHCRMLLLICKDCQAEGIGIRRMCELCQASKQQTVIQVQNYSLGKTVMVSPPLEKGKYKVNFHGLESKEKLRILCLHGFRQSASSLKGRLGSFSKKLKDMVELVFVDAPHEVPRVSTIKVNEGLELLEHACTHSKKYAWLVTPDMMVSIHETSPSQSAVAFDKDQCKKQIAGWSRSLHKIKSVLHEMGPFDGLLGFSQGAAVVSALCFAEDLAIQSAFRFVILCSGFRSPAPEHSNLIHMSSALPSLHVFGGDDGNDRQITIQDSMELVSLFNPINCVLLKHKSGHIIPCQKEYIDQFRVFLRQFL